MIRSGVLTLIFLMFLVQRFLAFEQECNYFVDELLNVFAPLNFFRYGIYSPHAPRVGYEVSVSSGLISTWPAALGFTTSGNFFGARVAYWSVNLITTLVLGITLVRSRFKDWIAYSLPLTMALLLVAYGMIPYFLPASAYILGEVPGALWMGLGFVALERHPRRAAVLFGIAVWHCKFIYIPFAGLGLLYRSLLGAPSARASLQNFLRFSAAFFAPLLLWMAVILLRTGPLGFWRYLYDQLSISFSIFFGGYSQLGHSPSTALQGLERFSNDQLEWVRYLPKDRTKILWVLFAPLVWILIRLLNRRVTQARLSAQDFLWIGWTLLTLAYAYWWFFLHTYMFIRHLLPLLAMSAGVLFYQLLSFTYHRRSRFPGWAFAILIFLLCAKELSRSPGFYEDISSPEYSTRFSVLCRSTPAWQADDLAMRALCSGPLPHP